MKTKDKDDAITTSDVTCLQDFRFAYTHAEKMQFETPEITDAKRSLVDTINDINNKIIDSVKKEQELTRSL